MERPRKGEIVMSAEKLEKRVEVLEAELARVKAQIGIEKKPWWEEIAGTFANDPIYLEAMRLGRKYRESTRPKAKKRKKPNHGNS
jgi:hypothetical protein